MTMHRDVAARIGPFDERFGAGGPLRSAEDTDYLVRALLNWAFLSSTCPT